MYDDDEWLDDMASEPLERLIEIAEASPLDGESMLYQDRATRRRIERRFQLAQQEAKRLLDEWPTCPECGAYINEHGTLCPSCNNEEIA